MITLKAAYMFRTVMIGIVPGTRYFAQRTKWEANSFPYRAGFAIFPA